MSLRNGKIILCKDINLDENYINVLDYTEDKMLELCMNKSIARDDHYSFIRKDRKEIQVDFPYEVCLQANYMAFQNTNYSNKWFFAFITDCEYVGDRNTKIKFEIDEHSTWFDYWNPKNCLVVREHVSDDRIGLHTFPEQIETGDYICNYYEELGGFSVLNSKIVVATSWLPNNTPGIPTTQYYGGVFSGVYYIAFSPFTSDAKNFILALDGLGRGSSIVSVFMAPSSLCIPITEFQGTLHSYINNDDGTTSKHDYTINGGFIGNNQGGVNILTDYEIGIQRTLDGYTPKNNKLLSFPFNYLLVSNNNGATAEFHYEDFINNTPVFNIHGTLSPGCSIRLFPENYKKIADGTNTHPGFSYGLVAGKFPICSYSNDAFVNWMTQQSVNHTTRWFGEAVSLGAGILTGGELEFNMFGSGNIFNTAASYMNEVYQHSLVAPQQHGSLNGSDSAFAIDENNFAVYKMSIKSEFARMCDDYLTKYGYKINRIKLPNMTSRRYFNYIQIGTQEEIGFSNSLGSVPSSSMSVINNIYRRGVTIWHDHDTIGNYSLDNSIV